jgi:hypothetical protein
VKNQVLMKGYLLRSQRFRSKKQLELTSASPGDEIGLSIGSLRKLIRYECIRDSGGSFQLIPFGEIFVDPTYSISDVNIADAFSPSAI